MTHKIAYVYYNDRNHRPFPPKMGEIDEAHRGIPGAKEFILWQLAKLWYPEITLERQVERDRIYIIEPDGTKYSLDVAKSDMGDIQIHGPGGTAIFVTIEDPDPILEVLGIGRKKRCDTPSEP